MDITKIGKKIGLEPFLIETCEKISDKKDVKEFLAKIASDPNSANRLLIDGNTRLQRFYMPSHRDIDERLENAVIRASGAGPLIVSEPYDSGFYMHVDVPSFKNGQQGFVDVKKRGENFYIPYATQITLRNKSVSVFLTIGIGGNIYAVQSADKNNAAELKESHFWNGLLQNNHLKLDEISPKVVGNLALMQRYTATDKASGATLTMGPAYMADEISIKFKTPVQAERLKQLFCETTAEKHLDGKYMATLPNEGYAKSFRIDAKSRSDTMLYVGQLVELARHG
jgi:hypothetical protein